MTVILQLKPDKPFSSHDMEKLRRSALKRARSLPFGVERNQQRQIALSLKGLAERMLPFNKTSER